MSDMIADFLTKGLSGEQFEKLCLMAGVTQTIDRSIHPEQVRRSIGEHTLARMLLTVAVAVCVA